MTLATDLPTDKVDNVSLGHSSGHNATNARVNAIAAAVNAHAATLAPTRGGFGGTMEALAAGESAWLTVQGDSTGNDDTEWPTLLAAWLGAQFPTCRVQKATWNDTTQTYGAWTLVQADSGGLGERHVMFTNPGRTAFLPPGQFTMPTGDLDVRVKLSLTDWTPAANVTAVGRYGAAAARGFYLGITTTGAVNFIWTADGTTNIQKVSQSLTGFADGSTGWIRATLDVDNGTGGYTWLAYTSPDGITWTQVGTSSTNTGGAASIFVPAGQNWEIGGRGGNGEMMPGGKIYEVQIRDGIDGKIVNPQGVDVWLPNPTAGANTIPGYGGAPTLYLLNGSQSGADLTYLTDSTRLGKLTRPAPGGLVFLSCSHNDTSAVGAALTATWDAWLVALKTRLPGAAFCVLTQNPQTAPRTLDLTRPHAQRRRDLIAWAARNAVSCIDVYGAFLADARGLAALTNADGLHPLNTAGTGSQLWADTVRRAFEARA